MLSVIVLVVWLGQAAGHEAINPPFRALLTQGVSVGERKLPIMPPKMADGLDAKGQLAVLREVAGREYDVEELLRESKVAPQVIRIRDVAGGPADAPWRAVDVYFVAYGKLDTAADAEFLERFLTSNRKGNSAKTITAAELARRKLPARQVQNEGTGYLSFDFLDRVRLSVVGHSCWSRTDQSIVAAAYIDPAFNADPEYPNQWQAIQKDGDTVKLGKPSVYSAAGLYLKITELVEPKGALFVEAHAVFAEPEGWFDGANLLRSRLPAVIQNNVRQMRDRLRK
jgi:hypothetical protein